MDKPQPKKITQRRGERKEKRGLKYKRKQGIPVMYDNVKMEIGLRADIIVEDKVIVEIKFVELLAPIHHKILLTYLKLTNTRTFNGSLTTRLDSLGIPVQGTIGFSVTIQSQDDIIRQLKISRVSYFAGAFVNQGQDFTNDRTFIPASSSNRWPAYDVHYWNKSGANMGWTWPYNSF